MNRHAKTWVGRWLAPVAIGSALLAGCSTQTEQKLPSTSPSSATTSTTPTRSIDPTAPARAAALAAYAGFWAAKVASQADPTQPPPKALEKYSTDKALAEALATVLILRRNKIHMQGAPTHAVQVVQVQTDDPTRVTLTDCLDSSKWIPLFTETGKSALAPGQSARVVVESVATQYAGRWVIKSSVAYRDRSC